MNASPPGLPDPLIRFLELFHRQEFWESHEVLEEPWRKDGSRFYHGLILLASAYVHVQRDNTHGIAAQLGKAEAALAPFTPHYLGLDVDVILERARALRSQAEAEAKAEAATESEAAEAEPGAADHAGDASRARHDPWPGRVTFPRLAVEASRIRGDEPELGQTRTD